MSRICQERRTVSIVWVNIGSINVHHTPIVRSTTTNITPAFVAPSYYYTYAEGSPGSVYCDKITVAYAEGSQSSVL